eukprot:TRINITY_DN27_c1_g1_i11.p1 TRINITY_DN27_c1_g1~~TRINITY_DN27_c1_g1_i11.p1  ORF type:complete len:102 (-),score=3.69 TRINITY_DN27_c1_g1_i11:322-627(-)
MKSLQCRRFFDNFADRLFSLQPFEDTKSRVSLECKSWRYGSSVVLDPSFVISSLKLDLTAEVMNSRTSITGSDVRVALTFDREHFEGRSCTVGIRRRFWVN